MFTINTNWGLFQYNYLTYSISSTAPIFQFVIDRILKSLKSTICYLDDVLIHDKNLKECYDNVCAVLDFFVQHTLKVNIDKCVFFQKKCKLFGLYNKWRGSQFNKDEVLAVKNASAPKDSTTQLKSYLSLLNFYLRSIPNISTELKPLYNFLEKNVKLI